LTSYVGVVTHFDVVRETLSVVYTIMSNWFLVIVEASLQFHHQSQLASFTL